MCAKYPQKSPTYLQKCPGERQKSPVYHPAYQPLWFPLPNICPQNIHKKALYIHKRALYIHKRALYIRKRALNVSKKKTVYTTKYPKKSPQYPQKSPLYPQKSFKYPQKTPVYTTTAHHLDFLCQMNARKTSAKEP